jgi:hypothetical protein
MDEQSQFGELLSAARDYLPPSVLTTCLGLNEHGEWEIALGHCIHHLQGVQLPSAVSAMLVACEQRFGTGTGSGTGAAQRRPTQSLCRTVSGRR